MGRGASTSGTGRSRNLLDPVGDWKVSTKPSKVPSETDLVAVWPESMAAATSELRHRKVSLVLLSTKELHPRLVNGWLQFHDGGERCWTTRFYSKARFPMDFSGYHAVFLTKPGEDDRVKFTADCDTRSVVVLEPSWIPALAAGLNALAWF